MKRVALPIFLSVMLFLTGLTGCGSVTENDDKGEGLALFLSQLNEAKTVEYNSIQTIATDKSQEKAYGHVEYTKKPFTFYQRTGIVREDSFVFIENYLYDHGETADYYVKTAITEPFNKKGFSIDKNGDFAVDDTLMKDPNESTATFEGDEKEVMIKHFDQIVIYDIGYLIEKNMGTFKQRDEETGHMDYIRYDGTISEDSLLDSYSDFGRERTKANMKMFFIEPELKENASKEEMKAELMTLYDERDIALGIYELIFAEEPAPISVWIPVNAEEPYKIKIDYSNAYMNKNIKFYNLGSQNSQYEKTMEYTVFL